MNNWVLGSRWNTCDIDDAPNHSRSQVTRTIKAFKIKLLLLQEVEEVSNLIDEWANLDHDYLQKLVDNMLQKVQAAID